MCSCLLNALIHMGCMQVGDMQRYVTRTTALDSLRQDTRFQEGMRDARVRGAVDAVIDNPENVTRLREPEAMACLNKLRKLRDVNKENGGGALNLQEATRAWTEDDTRRAEGEVPVVQLC